MLKESRRCQNGMGDLMEITDLISLKSQTLAQDYFLKDPFLSLFNLFNLI